MSLWTSRCPKDFLRSDLPFARPDLPLGFGLRHLRTSPCLDLTVRTPLGDLNRSDLPLFRSDRQDLLFEDLTVRACSLRIRPSGPALWGSDRQDLLVVVSFGPSVHRTSRCCVFWTSRPQDLPVVVSFGPPIHRTCPLPFAKTSPLILAGFLTKTTSLGWTSSPDLLVRRTSLSLGPPLGLL